MSLISGEPISGWPDFPPVEVASSTCWFPGKEKIGGNFSLLQDLEYFLQLIRSVEEPTSLEVVVLKYIYIEVTSTLSSLPPPGKPALKLPQLSPIEVASLTDQLPGMS